MLSHRRRFGLGFFVVAFFFPNALIGLFDQKELISESLEFRQFGKDYLRIASFSYFSITITFAIGMLMRSVEKVGYPQVIAISTVALNTFLKVSIVEFTAAS